MANWNDLFSGGGGGLVFPSTRLAPGDIKIKTAGATSLASNVTGFYTALEINYAAVEFDVATLQQVSNTLEQTIVNVSGSGVLTNILSCTLDSSGDMTIRITIDGELTTITRTISGSGTKILIGGYRSVTPQTASGPSASYGSESDTGYMLATVIQMLTPIQVVERGGVGMPFNSSLTVTIQGSVSLTAGASSHKCAVGYTLSLPEGL